MKDTISKKLKKFAKNHTLLPKGEYLKNYCELLLQDKITEDNRIQAYEELIDSLGERVSMPECVKQTPHIKRYFCAAALYEALQFISDTH